MSEKKSLFEMLDPKQAFIFGIIGGLLVLCTIGFFILLFTGGSFSSESSPSGRTVRTTDTTTPTAANPTPAQPTNVTIPEVTEEDHIRGNEDAAITIVEYSDIECPFCGRFHTTMQQVMDTYGDDVRWVYRHFPLESIHPNARPAAIAAECAAEQGKFWDFVDLAIARQSALSGQLEQIARDVQVSDIAAFNDCIADGRYNDVVSQDARDAQAAGGRGTPYSILIGPNGETSVISGAQPFANVEAQIQQFLN
jgi:protein-disulfide isomerase